jgi:cyclopropane fatty-acyl-phospholipid synthase-like methyltransferase
LGADLSENSIAEASKDTNDTLHFKVHDMSAFEEKYDAI